MCKRLLTFTLYLILLFTISCSFLLGGDYQFHSSKRGKYTIALPSLFVEVPAEERAEYATFTPLFAEGKFTASPQITMWKLDDEHSLANLVIVSQDCNPQIPKSWYFQQYEQKLVAVPYCTKLVSSSDAVFSKKQVHVVTNALEVQQKHNLWQKHYLLFSQGRMYTIVLTCDRTVFSDMEKVADIIVATIDLLR